MTAPDAAFGRVFRFEFMIGRGGPGRARDGSAGVRAPAAGTGFPTLGPARAAARCGSAPGWPAASGGASGWPFNRPRLARGV